jgi:type IV secretion system protein VirD4
MQLPPTDEIVMVSGQPPVRAKKARYFEDERFTERVLPPPNPRSCGMSPRADGWSSLAPRQPDQDLLAEAEKAEEDKANSGIRREPELPEHVAIAKETTPTRANDEFALVEDTPDAVIQQTQEVLQRMRGLARQVTLDPSDGLEL